MANDSLAELMGRIHRIHKQISDLRGRLERAPRLLQAQQANEAKIKERLEKVKEEYQTLLKLARDKEKHFTISEEAITKRKTQLQEAKNNKEFQALKLQINADEAANSLLADETLEAMEKAERFYPKVSEIEEELKKSHEIQEKTQKTIEKESPALQVEIERCQKLLEEAETEIPFKFREPYHRLVRGLGGEQAMAAISDQNFCGGCRQLVPINMVSQVVQGETPLLCKSCGRLLYVPEGFTIK